MRQGSLVPEFSGMCVRESTRKRERETDRESVYTCVEKSVLQGLSCFIGMVQSLTRENSRSDWDR